MNQTEFSSTTHTTQPLQYSTIHTLTILFVFVSFHASNVGHVIDDDNIEYDHEFLCYVNNGINANAFVSLLVNSLYMCMGSANAILNISKIC